MHFLCIVKIQRISSSRKRVLLEMHRMYFPELAEQVFLMSVGPIKMAYSVFTYLLCSTCALLPLGPFSDYATQKASFQNLWI